MAPLAKDTVEVIEVAQKSESLLDLEGVGRSMESDHHPPRGLILGCDAGALARNLCSSAM